MEDFKISKTIKLLVLSVHLSNFVKAKFYFSLLLPIEQARATTITIAIVTRQVQ